MYIRALSRRKQQNSSKKFKFTLGKVSIQDCIWLHVLHTISIEDGSACSPFQMSYAMKGIAKNIERWFAKCMPRKSLQTMLRLFQTVLL